MTPTDISLIEASKKLVQSTKNLENAVTEAKLCLGTKHAAEKSLIEAGPYALAQALVQLVPVNGTNIEQDLVNALEEYLKDKS